jgi:hypothetical protein
MLAWVFAALFMLTPVVASAVTSSYGSNYSYNSSSYKTMYACDAESDSNSSYAVFNTISSGTGLRVTDSNGSASGCGVRSVISSITSHKTCEDQDFTPDPCGGWKYTQ